MNSILTLLRTIMQHPHVDTQTRTRAGYLFSRIAP